MAVHIVHFEPDSIYVPGFRYPPDFVQCPVVQLDGRSGIDDIQSPVLPCHLLQHRFVDGKRVRTGIGMVVAERTLPPAASRTLQKKEFPRETPFGNDRISVHFILLIQPMTA